MNYRKIIHVDMDAFYASVEQRNNPQLHGKPVIVGGNPKSRGVVASCSYEARRYGIHSAMASSTAYRLCPHAVFVNGNFDEYIKVSRQIRDIFYEYTDLVEPLSLDEAYLDVTENKVTCASATMIAREAKQRIFERTRLTASAGVSFNKFLAKVASDFRKPNGITVVTPELADRFIDGLAIGKFYGIGKVTEKRMQDLGIKTGADLKKISREDLTRLFGKAGGYYYDIAHGLDDRPVEPYYLRKSIGKETTLEHDTDDRTLMTAVLKSLSGKVSESLDKHRTKGKTVTLKVKYADFTSVTRSITISDSVSDPNSILMHAENLLGKTEAGIKKVRLLGISVSNLDIEEPEFEEQQLVFSFIG
ncbi:MAG: DNA polymerase IV [Spirochaetes bacterium RBG_16_49_21]|nr:MAG: DNA polymerase IV [Spirochaetes bacterium RBG_16_49_21]